MKSIMSRKNEASCIINRKQILPTEERISPNGPMPES